jgi:hypothetical protein
MKPKRFVPPNNEVDKILERLQIKPSIKIEPKKAISFGRHKKIRELRKLDHIFIAHDTKKKKSIILLDGVKLRKEDNGYYFDFIL